MKRKALGKGIRSIIPQDTQESLTADARQVRLSEIRPNPFQPREAIVEDIEEMVESIKSHGILQPVILRRRRDGYELVTGERRFRAAQSAGLASIPAIVREVTNREMLEITLVENLQRRDLNPIEEAGGYKRLVEDFKLKQEDVAKRVGKDRSTVANALRLLTLPFKVRDLLAAGQLTAGHARALLSLPNRRQQVAVAERVVHEGLSVRVTERICSRDRPPRKIKTVEVSYPDVVEGLQVRLGTKVRVLRGSKGRGRIVVDYFSEDDLARIVALIMGG